MKTWFVTGASSGFGLAIAKEVLRRGNRVALALRDPKAVADLVRQFPEQAKAVRLDVTRSSDIASAVAEVLAWSGGVDVLINNAGHGFHGAVEEVSDAEARALFDVNVFGLLNVTRAVLPGMRERRSGHIINIGSVAGLVGNPGTGLYGASKFALEGLSEALHGELEPLGIRVTLAEPGPFRTEFNGRSIKRAAMTINDYKETAGKRSAALRAGSGSQVGDPRKMAVLICEIVESETPPLHLVIGRPAIDRARQKIAQLAAEIDEWEQRTDDTAFDEQA